MDLYNVTFASGKFTLPRIQFLSQAPSCTVTEFIAKNIAAIYRLC